MEVDRVKDSLIQEYDQIVSELQQQIQLYKDNSESLKQSVKTVTDENERLHLDLQRACQHLESPSIDLLKEKQASTNMLRQAGIELEQAQKTEQETSLKVSQYKTNLVMCKKELSAAQQSLIDLQESYDKLQVENQKSIRTAKKFHSELTMLREEQNESKKEINKVTQKNIELMSLLESTRDQLMRKTAEMNSLCMKESSSDQRVSVLQAANNELESRLTVLERDCSKLSEVKTLLETDVVALQEKITILESREHVAVDHVKESMQLLEAALAEKEQADIKEQHYVSEIRHLEKKLSVLLEEAGARTKLEVEKVRTEFNKNIDIMAAEIEHLEKQCAQKQSQIDKLHRDKEGINEGLKKVTINGPEEQAWMKESLKESRSKLLQSERSKHEALSQLNAMKITNSNLHKNLIDEQRKSAYFEEGLKEQRQINHSDSQQFCHEISLLTEINKAFQEQINEMTSNMQLATKECEQKVKLAHEELEMKEKELNAKLKYAEENQQKIASEFKQQMLIHQQSANRWQKEVMELHSKFEKALLDMNAKLIDTKAKNKELTTRLHRLTSNNKSANLTIDEYERTIASLNDKLSEAEASAEQRRQQVSLLITREKKALKEKEELNRLLHKAKYQMAQSLNVADASFFGMDHTHLRSSSKIAEFYGQSHDELSTSSTKTIDA